MKSDQLFQVALLQSLMQGEYDGIITVGELKTYGDTGIGTFLNLSVEDSIIEMDIISEFNMIVPNRGSFNEKGLSLNMKEAIEEVEGK